MSGGGASARAVLVVARRDPLEAMRVAAGITVFGHRTELVFAHGPLEVVPAMQELVELLDLAEISPRTLHDDDEVPGISDDEFHELVASVDFVINV